MILPSAATPPPSPPPESRKGPWVALGVVGVALIGVVLIGVIVILVLNPGYGPGDPGGPTAGAGATQSTTAPPSTTPTPGDTTDGPATTAPESSPPETTAPAVNQFQAYCDVYFSLEGEIETLARDSSTYAPDPSLPLPDEITPEELARIRNGVVGAVTPLLADLEQVQAAGPPSDVSETLAELGSEFQTLLSIFQRHDPTTTGDAMNAADWAKKEVGGMIRTDYIEKRLEWVQGRSDEVCG